MSNLWKILVWPRQVFGEIRETTPFAWPLWSILIVGFICYTIAFTDFDKAIVWELKGSEWVPFVPYYFGFHLTGNVLLAIWNVCCVLLVLFCWAGYYYVAGKVLKVDASWRNWFGFSCWAAVPAVLGAIAGVAAFKIADVDMIDYLEAFPFFWWFGMMALNLFLVPIPLVATLVIATIGLRSWTEKNWVTCVLVACIPVILLALGPLNSVEVFPSVLSQ